MRSMTAVAALVLIVNLAVTDHARARVFKTVDGEVAMEAEDYSRVAGTLGKWRLDTDTTVYYGWKGSGYMQGLEAGDDTWNNGKFLAEKRSLEYDIHFGETGRYYIHFRALAKNHNENGFFATLDGNQVTSGYIWVTQFQNNHWTWVTGGAKGEAAIPFDVSTVGRHTFAVYFREPSRIDRIWLTKKQPTAVSSASLAPLSTFYSNSRTGTVSGNPLKWHPVAVSFSGPSASESDSSPNPFLDYRLQVSFVGPSAQRYDVPGFFDGNGKGGGTGNVWRARFAPDEAGQWTYTASFRKGSNLAVDLSPRAGLPTSFDGASGSFTVAARDPNAPGFLRYGKLEYSNTHYLKFRDGSYWLKVGTDDPENLLAYTDFDNTTPTYSYEKHVGQWQSGDPTWGTDRGKGIIGALNYLSSKGVNSIYFLTMNIGGDGKDVWPFAGSISPGGSASNDNSHYDIGKLAQWETVFDHATRKGIYLHFVLNEAEVANIRELDGGDLGTERKLYYRELVARFGHHLGLQWNLCEEWDGQKNATGWTVEKLKAFADYIQAVDPYGNPIAVHNNHNPEETWPSLYGDTRFSVVSLQRWWNAHGSWPAYPNDETQLDYIENLRAQSAAAGRPLVVGYDEDAAAKLTVSNVNKVRKIKLWPVLLSGGNFEQIHSWTDNFAQYASFWEYCGYAREFVETHLPFWEMSPADHLLSGESTIKGFHKEGTAVYSGSDQDPVHGQVFAKAGEVYAVYLPSADSTGSLDLSDVSGDLEQRWFNPRTGQFEGATRAVAGGESVSLGSPPSAPSEDWVVLIGHPPDPLSDGGVADGASSSDGGLQLDGGAAADGNATHESDGATSPTESLAGSCSVSGMGTWPLPLLPVLLLWLLTLAVPHRSKRTIE